MSTLLIGAFIALTIILMTAFVLKNKKPAKGKSNRTLVGLFMSIGVSLLIARDYNAIDELITVSYF